MIRTEFSRTLTRRRHAGLDQQTVRPVVSRGGMAALEVVMVLGAMFPLAFLVFRLIAEGLRMYHAHVANVVGSPLL